MSRFNLPVRPKPYPNETAGSLLIRATQLNGYASVYSLLSGTGMRLNEPSLRACLIDQSRYRNIVQRLTLGTEAESLAVGRVSHSRRAARAYRNISIPDNAFRQHDTSAYCPECLASASYWRQSWTIRPFAGCVEHQCLLLDHCPNCGSSFKPGRGTVTHCDHCKASLANFKGPTIDVNPIRKFYELIEQSEHERLCEVLTFWKALTQFDGDGDQPEVEYSRLKAALQFSLGELEVVEQVAHVVQQRVPLAHPRIQLVAFLTAGEKYEAFANDVLARVIIPPSVGTGHLHQPHLSKQEVCSILTVSNFELSDMIKNEEIIWPQGREQRIPTSRIEDLLFRRRTSRSFVAETDATQRELDTPLTSKNRASRRKKKQKQKQEHAAMVDLEEAASKLGISITKVRGLLRKQILEGREKLVTRPSILKLLRNLRKPEFIPLTEAARKLELTEKELLETWVKNGVVTLYDFDLWKFAGRSDIKVVEKVQKKYMPISEVAQHLNIKMDQVIELDKNGLLPTLKLRHKNTLHLLYERETVQAMHQKQFLTQKVARTVRAQPNAHPSDRINEDLNPYNKSLWEMLYEETNLF